MKRKSAAEVLREVSPGLTIIPGGAYPHGPRKKASKLAEQPKLELPEYEPHQATEEEWEASEGVSCPICGKTTVRLFSYGFMGNRKACKACVDRMLKLLDHRAKYFSARRRRR